MGANCLLHQPINCCEPHLKNLNMNTKKPAVKSQRSCDSIASSCSRAQGLGDAESLLEKLGACWTSTNTHVLAADFNDYFLNGNVNYAKRNLYWSVWDFEKNETN